MKRPHPDDRMQAASKLESAVFHEIYLHGGHTLEALMQILRKQRVKASKHEVEAALKAWQKRKWIHRSTWKWYLTDAAIQEMR